MVALLCVIGQGLPLIHLLIVRHARCELHGETIHVSDADTSHTLNTSPTDPTTSSIRSSEKHADDHDHEHCQVLSDRRDQMCDGLAIVGPVPPSTDDIEQLRPATPSTSRRLYRLAPKLSPPPTA